MTYPLDRVAIAAARRAGLASDSAELIRHGSHALFRLPGHVVARVGPEGSEASVHAEAVASRHLAAAGISVVRTVDVPQPIVEHGRPVTFWHELPQHRPASPAELATVLHQLHQLPKTAAGPLPTLDAFAKLAQRIEQAPRELVTDDTRRWLTEHHDRLLARWQDLPPGRPTCVVHGDAWQGNVAVPLDGGRPVLLDLEHLAIGRPEWDLTPMAVDYVDFERLDTGAYKKFVDAYDAYDVTTWASFRTMADIQELRWTCFALELAARNDEAAAEAAHRIACIRGTVAKPWTWAAL